MTDTCELAKAFSMSERKITLERSEIRRVEVVEAIRIIFPRGDGVVTPVREVVQFWTMDGDLLVEQDHWLPDKGEAPE